MTEQEAKTKWCPQSFAPAAAPQPVPEMPGHTRGGRSTGFQALCIGSACMAWRFGRSLADLVEASYEDATDSTHGYCGIGGKP